jgi:Tfp pilus assembly protein PilF
MVALVYYGTIVILVEYISTCKEVKQSSTVPLVLFQLNCARQVVVCIRLFPFVFLAFAVSATAGEPSRPADPSDQKQAALIGEGIALLKQHQARAAITASFDKAIAAYEEKFLNEKRKIYAARWPTESLLYLTMAASDQEKPGAIVVSWVWALGFYYKGYALNEMGNLADAKIYLDRAISLSPQNAMFLLERANADLKEKNFQAAFDRFKAAEEAARISPPNVTNQELARSWRGMGYVFAEQNRLDEAEKIYLRCLGLDKGDKVAAAELKYVRDLKAKAARSQK